MQITFKGKPFYISEVLFREAIEFYGAKLLPKKILKNIKVTIAFDIKKNDENVGYCSPNEDIKSPRSFTISLLKTKDTRYLFEILAHEMVHLKQFALNELYFYDDRPGDIQSARWKKKDWDYSDDNVIETPWEKQAYLLEKYLIQEYFDEND